MRLLGALELSSGWYSYFDVKHVRGILNVAADGISRWDCAAILLHVRSVRPDVCTSVLASGSCKAPLRPRLKALIRRILVHG